MPVKLLDNLLQAVKQQGRLSDDSLCKQMKSYFAETFLQSAKRNASVL